MFYGDIDRDALYHKVVGPEFYRFRLDPVPATIFYFLISSRGPYESDLAAPIVPRLCGHDSFIGIDYTEAVLVAVLNTALVRLPLIIVIRMWSRSRRS